MSAGTVFTELDLDFTKFERNQQKLLSSAKAASTSVEKNWQNLGAKSDNIFNAMRASAENSFNMIKNHAGTSAAEISRAHVAMQAKIDAANKEQFGNQKSLIDNMKSNWIAASAAIVGAWMLVNKAVGMMDEAGKALQVESSFKIMANAAGVSSERLIESMKAATKETIDDSDLMQKAVKLMTLGFDPEQIERFSQVVITASQIAGTTAAEAYDQLADAIGNRMPKALVRMGAITREQMKDVTAAITAGADETVLFELAMANLELKQKMLQGTQDEATISLQKFHAEVKETGESIGKGLIWAVQELYGGFQWIASGALAAYGGLLKIAEGASLLQSKLPGALGDRGKADYESYKADAEAAFAAAEDLAAKSNANIMGTADVSTKATAIEIANAQANVDAQVDALKQITAAAVKDKKERESTLRQFEKEYTRAMRGMTEVEIEELNVRIDKYRQYGADEVKLEEMKQAELKQIMIRANNEQIALLEELYKYTGNTEYAQAALDLMKEINDAEQEKWSKILRSDQAGYELREKRDWDYYNHLFGVIDDRVDKEKDAIKGVVDYASSELSSIKSSGTTGAGTGGGGAGGGMAAAVPLIDDKRYYAFYDAVLGTDYLGLKKAAANQKVWAEKQATEAAAAAQLTEEIAAANKQIADEYQREYDSRVSTLASLYGQYASYTQDRTRKSWGQAEYQQEFAKLATDFGSSKYFETSIDLLGQMIDVIKELDSIEQEQLAQQKQAAADLKESSKSISDWLSDLSQGALAPVQGAGGWAAKFEELRTAAMADEGKVADFLSYAQKYLQFEKGYGTSGSYNAAYQSVTSAVGDLGGYMDLASKLADLGLGESITDINNLIAAFVNLGVSASQLNAAATAAAASTVGVAAGTSSFKAAIDLLKASEGTASGGAWSLSAAIDYLKTAQSAATAGTGSLQQAIDYLKAAQTGTAGVTWSLSSAIDYLKAAQTTATPGTSSLASAIGIVKDAASTASGSEGLQKIIDKLAGDLPQSAVDSMTNAGLLSKVLSDATPYANTTALVTTMTSNVKSQLQTVAGFFDTLATKMGLTLNGGSAATAIANLTPPAVQLAATHTVITTVQTSPFTATGTGIYYHAEPAHGFILYADGSRDYYKKGGLTDGIGVAGESGPEWVVPTYEPERSKFLRDVGADPETIGKAIARNIQGIGGGGGDIHVSVQIDGREIGNVVARQIPRNRDLTESIRRLN